MTRGGKRENAGRKSNAEKGIPRASEIRRIPRELIEEIDELIVKQRKNEYIPRKYEIRQQLLTLQEQAAEQQQRIMGLEQQNDTLMSRVNKLSEDIDIRDGVIEELKGHNENLKHRISKHENELDVKQRLISNMKDENEILKRKIEEDAEGSSPENTQCELLRKVLIERQKNSRDTRNWTELNKLLKELNEQNLLT